VSEAADEARIRPLIGLYLLGALDAKDRAEVDAHLTRCAGCRREADELGEAVTALAMLSDAEGQDLVREFGIPDGEPLTEPKPQATPPSNQDLKLTIPAPKRTRRALITTGSLVVVVVVAAVLALVVAFGPSADQSQQFDVTLAATAGSRDSGVSLSVFLTGRQGTTTVRATVAGLPTGTHYQLKAFTTNGQEMAVCDWFGAGGAQDVGGDVQVPVGRMSFFRVSDVDSGTVLVSAYLTRGQHS
jgi:anti-sigma-K factor RskA